MELRHLQYFLSITECASMTEAASKIHVSQPALSNTIRELESELGYPLFERNGKRLQINESGKYFAQRVKTILNTLDEAISTAENAYSDRSNTINLGLRLPIGDTISDFLKQYSTAHPQITIRIGYEDARLFDHSSIDVTIFASFSPIEDDSAVFLGKERFVVVLPAHHPLADQDTVALSQLSEERFILSEESEMRGIIMSMFTEAGFTPSPICETQLFTDALSFAEAGIGLCIAPEVSWFDSHKPRYDVAIKPLQDTKRYRYLYARIDDRSPSHDIATDFVKQLQSFMKDL